MEGFVFKAYSWLGVEHIMFAGKQKPDNYREEQGRKEGEQKDSGQYINQPFKELKVHNQYFTFWNLILYRYRDGQNWAGNCSVF